MSTYSSGDGFGSSDEESLHSSTVLFFTAFFAFFFRPAPSDLRGLASSGVSSWLEGSSVDDGIHRAGEYVRGCTGVKWDGGQGWADDEQEGRQ